MYLAPLSSILVYFGKISDILPFYQFIFFTSILLGLLRECLCKSGPVDFA